MKKPAIASLEELKAFERQLEQFQKDYRHAFERLVEILSANKRIGYKNLCRLILGEAPEKLKSERL